MRNTVKKILAMLLALSLVFALAACGQTNNPGTNNPGTENPGNSDNPGNTAVEPVKAHIGVAFYKDAGADITATKAYLESLSETLNVTYTYTVLTSTDESYNLTKIQELISAGVDGIICTMDVGTQAILDECEAAGVYLAGYYGDYNTSYTTNYDNVFKSDYFLGCVADGMVTEDWNAGYAYFDTLIEYNERNPEDPITHVSMAIFPTWAYPTAAMAVEQFMESVDAYNAEHPDAPITADPLDEDSDVLMFAPMDSTYFAKHPDIDAIMSFAAGSFVYPTMVAAGVDSTIKLFAAGYEVGDDANFGSNGTGTYQHEVVCAIESINYPLILILNKVNGVDFPDMPEDAGRVSCPSIIINSDEDLAIFKESLYLTGNAADAMFTPEEILNMTAFGNPNATYADLVETLNHMTIDDI